MLVKRKVLALSTSIMVFASSLCFGVLLLDSNGYEKEKVVIDEIENNYAMYIKGDDIIKLSLKEKFHSCKVGDKIKTCGLIKDDVISAKSLLTNKEISDFDNRNVIEVVNDILNSTDNKTIEITTNWNNRYTDEELFELFDNKDKTITIEFKKDIDEQTLKSAYYKVKIDAKNGTPITELNVKKNSTIELPKKPTKKGYTFVEWQVKGKKYDFDKKVKSDITLVAKWKKKSK